MSQLNATTFCAFALTVIALYLLSFFPFIPPWAVFIAWACFFHMDGGANRQQAYFANILHIALGAFGGWVSAIVVLNNPFETGLAAQLWAPVFIGLVIAVLSRMGTMTRFCVTPAVIYGYASVFAFASTTGFFSLAKLLSLSFSNALIAIVFSVVIGTSAAYFNAWLVGFLSTRDWSWLVRISKLKAD